ncbi:hypothetical protein VNO78_28950 [Psophocarpus tetragonolobus]|uniref:Uncharacterized protein n=1 Tax=Psophocarpus tetragonolobus TaxID=3891 RepID=A0AAN9RUL5_PSOTE
MLVHEKSTTTPGSCYGTFMYAADTTLNKVRLNVAKFLISTRVQEVIDYAVKININGQLYEIKICKENLEDCSSYLLCKKRNHYSNSLTNNYDEIASSSLLETDQDIEDLGTKDL